MRTKTLLLFGLLSTAALGLAGCPDDNVAPMDASLDQGIDLGPSPECGRNASCDGGNNG